MTNADKEIIEKVNIVLEKIDTFFHGLEPSLKSAISRDKYFEQHPEITDHKNFNFSLSGDDIINKKIPYNVAGCTGRAKLFSKYAQEIGLQEFNIVATAKKEGIKNKNSGKMIDGHQLVVIKLSDGLHMIDPGKGKTYEKAQIDGICKVGENIDAVGHNQKDYVISAILKPSEYDNIKTYQQMANLYLRGGFNAGINKIKEKDTNKIIANRLFQLENE
ncbi:MAG: hypothetical protein J6J82_01340 [Alphaproteobacteria bacterium]|nr:hypothetical protein [Alphaproteobacteria bacterium]